jgi:hypothetical protein
MSESEEIINNLNKSIQEKTNEIDVFRNELTSLPNTLQNTEKIKRLEKRIIQRQKAIKENTQQLNTLKQLQQTINKANRITSSINTRKTISEPEKEEQEEQEEKDEQEEQEDDNESTNLIGNNPQLSRPGDIEMTNLASDTRTRKNRGSIPRGRLSAPLQSPQLTRRNRPSNTGFSETIVPRSVISSVPIRPNMKLCPKILDTGKRVNDKFFIPSQFPNLTKPKPVTVKGGRKSRKHIKIKNRKRRNSYKRY